MIPGLDEVASSMTLLLSLLSSSSRYVSSIPLDARVLHFLHLFLFPSDVFSNDNISKFAADFLQLLSAELKRKEEKEKPTSLATSENISLIGNSSRKGFLPRAPLINFERVIGGEAMNFLETYADAFVHQSFGDHNQARVFASSSSSSVRSISFYFLISIFFSRQYSSLYRKDWIRATRKQCGATLSTHGTSSPFPPSPSFHSPTSSSLPLSPPTPPSSAITRSISRRILRFW